MSGLRAARLCTPSILGTLWLALTGCAFSGGPAGGGGTTTTTTGGANPGSPTPKAGLGGRVFGGTQSPITGATVTLWAAGTGSSNGTGGTYSYGTGATSIATTQTGNTCGTTLAIGANCSITVTFASSTAGAFSAALNVASNAVGIFSGLR